MDSEEFDAVWQVLGVIGGVYRESDKEHSIVGIRLPHSMDPDDDEEDQIVYMTLPCAQTLRVDLGEAIDACIQFNASRRGGE